MTCQSNTTLNEAFYRILTTCPTHSELLSYCK